MNAIRLISWNLALFCFTTIATIPASGQWNDIDEPGGVTLHGSASLSAEASDRGDGTPGAASRTGRLTLQAALTLGEEISIPAEIYATAENGAYEQGFNRVGVHPELWGWLTIHGGYHRANLSELTLDNDAIDGGGVEIHPGTFRSAFYIGTLRDGLEGDSLLGIQGAYRRRAIGLRIGHAGNGGDFVSFNAALVSDDTTSITERTALAPQENALASIAYGFPLIDDHLQLRGEVALSAFTNDIRDPAVDGAEFIHSIFIPRYSTQYDGAATLKLILSPTSDFDLLLDGRWIGPGYRTLGDPYLQSDILEARIAPSVDLFDGRLTIAASLGALYNNLRSQKLTTTRRIIGSIAAYAQPCDAFGISAHYMNYGLKTSRVDDTLRVANISQSLMLTPTLTFDALGGINGLMGTFSYDHASDAGSGDIAAWENRTGIAGAIWSLALPSSLSFTTSVMRRWSRFAGMQGTTSTLGEGVACRFFGNALFASLTLEYSVDRFTTRENYLRASIEASYAPGAWGTFSFSFTTRSSQSTMPFGNASTRQMAGALHYMLGF